MSTELRIYHNTNRAGLAGYSVALSETDDDCHDLRQIGPCENGLISYRGVFAREASALQAAIEYLPPCLIVRVDSPHGSEYRVVWGGWHRGRRLPDFATFTVMAARSAAGIFIHA